MKSNLHIIVSFCSLFWFHSIGQNIDTYGPFPKIPTDQFNFSYLTESYILLNKYNVIGDTPNLTRKNNWYHSIGLNSNSTVNSTNIKGSTGSKPGSVFKAFFTDKYIVEFIDFAAGATSNVGIGALKRDPFTFEIIADLKIVDEKIQYSPNNPNINIQQTSKGYVYTRVIDDHCLVSYLDTDFNELQTVTLKDEPTITKTASLLFYPFIEVNEKDELIIVKIVNISKDQSSFDFHITAVNPDGEVVEMNPNLKKGFPVKNMHINYSSDNKLFEGIFYWSIPPVMKGTKIDQAGKDGYHYIIWDENENKLVDFSKEFTIDDVCGEHKDALIKKYSEKKLGEDILSNFESSIILSSDEENYLIINRLSWTPELMKSTFIVKIDKNGKQAWSKMLFSNTENPVTNFGLTANKDLRILLGDFISTNRDDEHQPDIFAKQNSKELSSFFEIVIGKKDGELIKNNLLHLNLPEGSKLVSIVSNKNHSKYLMETLFNNQEFFSVISF